MPKALIIKLLIILQGEIMPMCLWLFENEKLTQSLKHLHFKYPHANKIQHVGVIFLGRFLMFT